MFSLDFIYQIEINNYCFFKIICEVLSKKKPPKPPKKHTSKHMAGFYQFLPFILFVFIYCIFGREGNSNSPVLACRLTRQLSLSCIIDDHRERFLSTEAIEVITQNTAEFARTCKSNLSQFVVARSRQFRYGYFVISGQGITLRE